MPTHFAQAVTARPAFSNRSCAPGSTGNPFSASLAMASAKSLPIRSTSKMFTPILPL